MNEFSDISFDLFEFQEFLGQGSFGTVLKALNKQTQQLVAVKIIKKKSLFQSEQLLQEAHILQELSHPNIVKFFGVHETDSRILIEMELIQGGSLSSISKCSEEQTKYIMYSIFNALQYMHNNNIAHRDLKLENILVTHDLSLLKVSDFGLSTGQASLMTKQCGTLIYMAPEQLNNKIYNKAIDIWAAGVIMYQLIVGQHPYYQKGCDLAQAQLNMHELCKPYLNDQSIQYSLFRRLTEINPTKRYSATQALLHPWFNYGNDEPLNMEEQFQQWKQTLKLHKFILALMLLNKLGYKKHLVNKEFYDQISMQIKQNQKLDFLGNYDQLFADYQKSLNEDQKTKISSVFQKMEQNTRNDLHTTIDSTKQSHSTILQSSKFLIPLSNKQPIKVFNINSQNQTPIVIEDIEQEQMMKLSIKNKDIPEKQIIRQQFMIQSTKLNFNSDDNQKLIQDNKILNQEILDQQFEKSIISSPTKSPQIMKKKRVKKTQIKQYLNDDIIQTNYSRITNTTQKQEYNNNIRQESPTPINKFKIQLKPLNHIPMMTSSQKNDGNLSLRPRNQKIIVDREFYAPPILDLSNLALECMSPKYRKTRAISLNNQKKNYSNDLHASGVLGIIGNNHDFFIIK